MLEGSPKTLWNSQKHIMWTLVQYQTWQTVLRGLILSINKLCSGMLCSLSNKAVMYYGCSKEDWWLFAILMTIPSTYALVFLWNQSSEFDSNPEHHFWLLASVQVKWLLLRILTKFNRIRQFEDGQIDHSTLQEYFLSENSTMKNIKKYNLKNHFEKSNKDEEGVQGVGF